MVIDIIDDQYFRKTKLRKIMSKTHNIIIILVLILFLIDFLFSQGDFSSYYYIFLSVSAILMLVISILDMSLFIRTGTVEFDNELMSITNENIINEINLTHIEKVQLKKVGSEMFVLKIEKHEILIELVYHNKIKFKNILKQYHVEIN